MSRAQVRWDESAEADRFMTFVQGVMVCARETDIWDHASQQETPVSRPGSLVSCSLAVLGAEDGIRTRDLLLGKEMLYH
jgi:hypothetical protein